MTIILIIVMDPFLSPEVPSSAKVLRLVSLHHGVQTNGMPEVPTSPVMKGNRLSSIWRAGGRLNHMRARRRHVRLEEIPESAYPVILELSQGSNFIVLKEKVSGKIRDSYLVQFPDSREALVQEERIRELYDGTCVFLGRREDRDSGGKGSGGRRGVFRDVFARVSAFQWKSGLASSLLINGLTFAAALGMMVSHRYVLGQAEGPSLVVPVMGVLLAAAVTLGIMKLRGAVRGGRVPSALVDLCFIPLFGAAVFSISGWSALPFLGVAGLVFSGLLLSNRLGRTPSLVRNVRPAILTLTFTGAALGAWWLVAVGLLNPSLMAGMIVTGTCFVNLFIESDVLIQELRLAAFA